MYFKTYVWKLIIADHFEDIVVNFVTMYLLELLESYKTLEKSKQKIVFDKTEKHFQLYINSFAQTDERRS